MNRIVTLSLILLLAYGCNKNNHSQKRVVVASAGKAVLYLDQLPGLIQPGTSEADSTEIVKNYISKWARKSLVFQKAEENLSAALKDEIENQLEETRSDLVIYQYQRQMMLERMDTVVTEHELEKYYNSNPESFLLSSNIVKALFIKLPSETPNIDKIRILARSKEQDKLQQLETTCYQFAEKFDDFNEQWVPLNRLSVELPQEIENQESFLRRTTYFETTDSANIYLISIRDHRLRSTLAPFEYVKDDIKRIILNTRRFEFIQALENGIYNNALKEDNFKIF
jgi:hypothetical protein